MNWLTCATGAFGITTQAGDAGHHVMGNAAANDVTALLAAWRDGDPAAAQALAALVYDDMRAMAARRLAGGRAPLQTTELVNETFARLLERPLHVQDRVHFFRTVAMALRQVLTDAIRRDRAQKRGGDALTVSLSAAGDLVRWGHQATVFEALHEIGGVLLYGIPEFRLPKEIVRHEVNVLRQMGVEFQTNVVVGKTVTIDELMTEEGYDAVLIATGAGLPKFLDVPGEHLIGVYSANEFLTRVNLMHAYDRAYDEPVFD